MCITTLKAIAKLSTGRNILEIIVKYTAAKGIFTFGDVKS